MNRRPDRQDEGNRRDCHGVILLITLVILVILATLGYTLTVRVAARRHRDQYLIDYSIATHACASGLKYALASMNELEVQLISRPNEPDFSDVFALSEPQYQELLAQMDLNVTDGNSPDVDLGETMMGAGDFNDLNDVNSNKAFSANPKPPEIPGPYGAPWPLVTEPVEFEIGSAKVKIEVEDENAKYPLGWAMLEDENLQAEAAVGWATFCEWMGYTATEIDSLTADLGKVREVRPFKVEFKAESESVAAPASLRSRTSRSSSTRARTPAPATATARRKTISVSDQVTRQNKEFATLFHSSMIDADLLARPSIVSDSRRESAMKYLGLWATRHVNINTAPRHVLEAALAFGSIADAPKIADAIIQQRKVTPVADVNELKRTILGYSDSIDDCKDFITTTSTVFTIRVTAVSGVAKATALAAVSKEGDKIEQIAVICD